MSVKHLVLSISRNVLHWTERISQWICSPALRHVLFPYVYLSCPPTNQSLQTERVDDSISKLIDLKINIFWISNWNLGDFTIECFSNGLVSDFIGSFSFFMGDILISSFCNLWVQFDKKRRKYDALLFHSFSIRKLDKRALLDLTNERLCWSGTSGDRVQLLTERLITFVKLATLLW